MQDVDQNLQWSTGDMSSDCYMKNFINFNNFENPIIWIWKWNFLVKLSLYIKFKYDNISHDEFGVSKYDYFLINISKKLGAADFVNPDDYDKPINSTSIFEITYIRVGFDWNNRRRTWL